MSHNTQETHDPSLCPECNARIQHVEMLAEILMSTVKTTMQPVPVKITVLVRTSGDKSFPENEGSILLSDDDIDKAIAALGVLKGMEQEQKAATHAAPGTRQ